MTDKMTKNRMDLIERCLKDRRLVPRDRVREMAAEIRRCWAEIERLEKILDERSCDNCLYQLSRNGCSACDREALLGWASCEVIE